MLILIIPIPYLEKKGERELKLSYSRGHLKGGKDISLTIPPPLSIFYCGGKEDATFRRQKDLREREAA